MSDVVDSVFQDAPAKDRVASVLSKRLLGEFFGSYFLMLSIFVVIASRARGMGDAITTEIARYCVPALALYVCVAIFDGVSAHFNPAVSLAFAVSKRLSWRDFGLFAMTQVGGSLLAAMSATWLIGGKTRRVLPNAARSSTMQVLVLELLGTVLLVAMYSATETRIRTFRPLFAAGAMLAAAMVIGPYTTLGVNPARTIGPSLWNTFGSDAWVFVVAPLLGGALVGAAWRFSPLIPQSLWRRAGGEFVGSFVVLFVAYAGIRAVSGTVTLALLITGTPIALFALAVIVRSDTFFNPAITLAKTCGGLMNRRDGLLIGSAQFAGGILAPVALRWWLRGDREILTIIPNRRISFVSLFALEAVATAVLVLVALRHSADRDEESDTKLLRGAAHFAAALFALAISLGTFGHSTFNLAWAIGTATGWGSPTAPRHLVWLVCAPIITAVAVGLGSRLRLFRGEQPAFGNVAVSPDNQRLRIGPGEPHA
jgi:aquaporin NIP